MTTVAPRRTRAALLLALAAVAVLGACAQPGQVATAIGAPPTPTPQAGGLPATQGGPCPTSEVPTGLSSQSVLSGGQRRPVLVYLPRGRRAGKPIPLVLDLHGSGSTPKQQLESTGITRTADRNGFAVVAPQGGVPFTLGRTHGFAWNVPGVPLVDGKPVPRGAPDDVQYLRETVETVTKLVCGDSQRVYVTGFSGGARMTSQLGCELSTRVAAIAPVSGLRLPTGCRPTRPVPVVAFHGTADTVNQYNGGKSPTWDYSVPVAAQRWAGADGCAPTPGAQQVEPLVTATTYQGCGGGAQVRLYTISGGKHAWPGTPGSMAKGLTPPRIDPNELMWTFFAAHPLGSTA
ncbi:hypothetical protein GCM10010174_75570 [Kutzneria viridogrisea]|uniref:Polyhydroxybutyrate depolymerase n=1 Tax=Kutzneria viridogrisea TaxID=47990 RepID=A0ABR6BN67_9PSEU|nr:polyhydroxybutyrate depolymerase [Kutzneria viridogrisea]